MSDKNSGKYLLLDKEGTNLLDCSDPLSYNCYFDFSKQITAGSIKALAKKLSEDKEFKKFVKKTTIEGKLEIRVIDFQDSFCPKNSEVLIGGLEMDSDFSYFGGKRNVLRFKSFLERYTQDIK